MQAYVARFTTDKLVALVNEMAHGKVDADGAKAALATFEVEVPAMPPTETVLKVVPKSDTHPGAQIRWALGSCCPSSSACASIPVRRVLARLLLASALLPL